MRNSCITHLVIDTPITEKFIRKTLDYIASMEGLSLDIIYENIKESFSLPKDFEESCSIEKEDLYDLNDKDLVLKRKYTVSLMKEAVLRLLYPICDSDAVNNFILNKDNRVSYLYLDKYIIISYASKDSGYSSYRCWDKNDLYLYLLGKLIKPVQNFCNLGG